MKYCKRCGGRLTDGNAHTCDEAGLEAMRRNPFLALLIKPDGTMNPDAPIIFGGGKPDAESSHG